MIPEDLPAGTVLRFVPQRKMWSAESGATAVVRGKAEPHGYKKPMIAVSWVRDGLDQGQNDGDYFCEDFELIDKESSRPCSCSFRQLASVGCQFIKHPDAQGFIHS